MEFADWISEKYVEWRGDKIGNEASITKFAALFKAPYQTVLLWMDKKKGVVPRSHKYINALATVYGDEVYEVLGLDRVETVLPIDRIPPDKRDRLERAIKEIADTLAERKIDPSTAEADRISDEIMARYGWIRTDAK